MAIFRGTGGSGDSSTDTTVNTVTQKAAEAAASATAAASSATSAANSAASINANIVNDTTPQLGGELDGQTNKITNIGNPTSAQDAATKTYVDSQVQSKDALSELLGDSDDITQGSTNLFLTTTERTKLSGIEASATADQTAAEIRTLVESATDSNVFTDADHSKLNGIEASATADQTDAEIKTAYENNSDTNAFTDAEQTKLSGLETGATADQTASEILTAIKTVDGSGSGLDADLLDGNQASAFATSAQGSTADSALQNVSEDTTPQLGGVLDTNGNNIEFGDNVKAKFGASDDLQIYHDGSHSYIKEVGTGNLRFDADNWYVRSADGSEAKIAAITNGAVSLYYDGTAKLATTSTGIDVTGTLVADGATIDGTLNVTSNALNLNASSPAFTITDSDTSAYHVLSGASGYGSLFLTVDAGSSGAGGGFFIQRNANTRSLVISNSTGDISFYNDAGTSQDFYWDASTSRLGLGTTSPFQELTVGAVGTSGSAGLGVLGLKSDATHKAIMIQENSGAEQYEIGVDANGSLNFYNSGSTSPSVTFDDNNDISFYNSDLSAATFRWDSSTSRLGIGTTSPEAPLEVAYTTSAPSLEESDAGLLLSASNTLRTIFGADPSAPYAHWIQVTNSSGSQAFPLALNPQGGNVGIGATALTSYNTQADDLVIKNASHGGITIHSGTTSTGNIFFADGTTGNEQYRGWVQYNHSQDHLAFGTAGTEAMRIDSSGRLLIGRTTGTSKLYVSGTSADIAINDNSGTYNYRQTTLKVAGDRFLLQTRNGDGAFVSQDYIVDKGSSGATSHQWLIDGSEAARIDSSGNLLVGKTSASSATVGQELKSSGVAIFTQSANPPIITNRLSSDGEIINFLKDGSTIGSIGVDNTDNIFLSGDSSHSGLMVGTESVVPYANGSTSDATEDLGVSSIRWRNLYLSGGVYLGGTGSANLLDDYEEGTWTPVLTMTTSGDMTATVQGTAYTKVGRMVHFQCYISAISGTSPTPSGEFRLTGLPFASKGSNNFTPINISYASILANQNDVSYGGYVQSGDTFIRFTTGGTSFVDQADITATSGGQIMVSGVYQTS